MDYRTALRNKLEEVLFRDREAPAGNVLQGIRHWFLNLLRAIYIGIYKSFADHVQFKAYGLTYITTLSIVPMLAVSFSVAKGLGMAEALREVLFSHVTGVRPEVLENILQYVENTNARTIGIVGVVFLFYTVTAMISAMERAFNEIWNVAEQRPLYRKFTDYISIVTVCPLLLLVATTVTASLSSNAFVEYLMRVRYLTTLVTFSLSIVPYVLSWLAIGVIYQLLPNTRVPVVSAISGGLIAGIVWQLVQNLYIAFQVGVAKYNAIYGSFASLPLFLIWLYLSWLILLFGAEIAYAFHGFGKVHPRYLRSREKSSAEALVMKVYLLMAKRFYAGEPAWPAREFALRLGVDQELVNTTLSMLEKSRLVVKLIDSPPRFQPARDLETISLAQVMTAVREPLDISRIDDPAEKRLEEILRDVRCMSVEKLSHISVKELITKQVPDS
ncbi:MAG: YihY family inner membrane protein [Deltaproteobacteria bacterium]|nr:YihY family inner membrane protein [Deltaproteobacteria bacterium]